MRQYSLKVDQEWYQVSLAVVLLADARIATGTAASRTYESGPLAGQPLASFDQARAERDYVRALLHRAAQSGALMLVDAARREPLTKPPRAATPQFEMAAVHRDALRRFARNEFQLDLVRPAAGLDSDGPPSIEAGTAGAPPIRTHRLSPRRDALAPVIDGLLRDAENPHDHAAIWNGLQALADGKDPPAPLAGIADGEVKYRNASGGISFITRDAFIKRLKRREAPQDAAKRRGALQVFSKPGG